MTLPDGKAFKRLTAGEHQHDDRAREIFADDDGRDDRDSREQVRAELPSHELDDQLGHERQATQGKHDDQRGVVDRLRRPHAKAQQEVQRYAGDGDRRDDELTAIPQMSHNFEHALHHRA